jgi:hypothetical protein
MITLYKNPNFDGSILTFDPKNVKTIYKLLMNMHSDSPFTLTDKPIDGLSISKSDFLNFKSVKNETDDFFLVLRNYLDTEIVTIQGSVNDTGFEEFLGYIEIFKKNKNCTDQIKTYKIVMFLFISLSVAIILILGVLVYIGQVKIYTTITPI